MMWLLKFASDQLAAERYPASEIRDVVVASALSSGTAVFPPRLRRWVDELRLESGIRSPSELSIHLSTRLRPELCDELRAVELRRRNPPSHGARSFKMTRWRRLGGQA